MQGCTGTVLNNNDIRAVHWCDDTLYLLDQRLLPGSQQELQLESVREVAAAISDMVVRGAPAIGVAAAYGVVMAARDRYAEDPARWQEDFTLDMRSLEGARPTAVNLGWAIERMRKAIPAEGDPFPVLLAEAHAILAEDVQSNRRMGELGAACFDAPGDVITHCNTGSLATGGYGTALGVIRNAYNRGLVSRIYAGETRPWMQGARLTAWELIQEDIPCTLLVEGAAAHLMSHGGIKWVIVGADRIAANGDVANKIGTYSLAVLARYHGVKFMVVAPVSTIDSTVASGKEIPIEHRPPEEVLHFRGDPIAAQGAEGFNPAFDITPANLVDILVTERGVLRQPNVESISSLFSAH